MCKLEIDIVLSVSHLVIQLDRLAASPKDPPLSPFPALESQFVHLSLYIGAIAQTQALMLSSKSFTYRAISLACSLFLISLIYCKNFDKLSTVTENIKADRIFAK